MSGLEDLFKKSNKQHVVEARQIPSTPKNFVDLNHQFLSKFELFDKPGDPTEFTNAAQNFFDTELSNLTRPAGFDPNTPFNQWNPKQPYFKPGDPK